MNSICLLASIPVQCVLNHHHAHCLSNTGTASAAVWKLRAEGHLFHSGLPHKGINSLELGMEAIAYLQKQFYQEFPPVCVSLRGGGEEG